MSLQPPDLRTSDPLIQRLLDWIRSKLLPAVQTRVTVNGVTGRLVVASGFANLPANSPNTHETQAVNIPHTLGRVPFALNVIDVGGTFASPLDCRFLSFDATNIIGARAASDVNITFTVGVHWTAWAIVPD